MKNKSWIGVDLDGTLAYYDYWRGVEHIGDPIPDMVDRIRRWLDGGIQVKIFTARVSDPDEAIKRLARDVIQIWCEKHIGVVLPVTNTKDFAMVELWDDRAVGVVKNVGISTLTHLEERITLYQKELLSLIQKDCWYHNSASCQRGVDCMCAQTIHNIGIGG